MGRRRSQRVSKSLPVRVFGTDAQGKSFVRLANTVDISTNGIRIGGVYVSLRVGDIVGVQYGAEKRDFRIVWTGKMGSRNAGEIGLQTLEPDEHIWGLNLPLMHNDAYEAKAGWAERRKYSRFECDLGIEVRTSPDGSPTLVRCTDISRGGCYLETWSPLSVGTKLYLHIKFPDGDLVAEGEVRTLDPAFGMGIRFAVLSHSNAFEHFLDEIQRRLNPQPAATATSPEEVTPTSSPHVLLAEDSRFLRNAYALYLRREGFYVVTADDGYQALSLAKSEHPDVIVLDLLMPRLGGVGALKVLKEDPLTVHIPVIILSGLPSSNESKLTESGAFAYLAKTQVGPEELPSHVKRALASIGQYRPNVPPDRPASYHVAH